MKFTRLNENVIRCVITKEEMFDIGIEVSDIVQSRDKAEDFLRKVMQEARYELDYKTQGGALSVQIAILPEGDVAMTIAETLPEQLETQMNMIKKYIEDFQKFLEQRAAERQQAASNTPGEVVRSFISATQPFWVRCSDFDACVEAAKIIDGELLESSALYSYKDEYFFKLEIREGEKIGELFLGLCEFGEGIFIDYEGAALIAEHGRCIIEDGAISILTNL